MLLRTFEKLGVKRMQSVDTCGKTVVRHTATLALPSISCESDE